MNIQNFKSIKIWIVAIFTLMTLCTFPISSFATIIVTETYDGLADWHCIVAGSAGISGSIWTSQSGCTYRNYNGFSHYGGEITTPGRGGTGKSLKQWRGPGTNENDYNGYLNYIFDSATFANHYRTIYSRWYVKIPAELNAIGCTGECPKFGGRIYGSTSAGQTSSSYQILFDLGNSETMKDSYFKIYNVNATAPYDTLYSLHPASYYNFFDGNWHSVEVGVVLGTNGQANGEEHVYIDGVEIPMTTWGGANTSVGQTHISHNWPANVYITYPLVPGVGNLTLTSSATWTTSDNQWKAIEWDDYVVSTSYIGPDSGSITPPPSGGDATSPTVTITAPTSNTTYSTSSSSVALSGTASDNIAVSSVKWACPTCTPTSGTGTGTSSWSVPSIGLASGSNVITVTATDSSNNTSAKTLAVTLTSSVVSGACGTASGQFYTSLTSSNLNLCATGTAVSFSGTGPWTWGCNGSGGGTNTASNACSASLTSATLLLSEDFEDSNYISRGWYDGTYFDLVNTEHANGSQSARFTFAQGATSWTGTQGAMRKQFAATDSLYVSFYIKFATGWRGSQQTYHPHMINILSDVDDTANAWSPLANNYLNTYIEFLSDIGSPYAIRPQLALQDEKNVNTSNGTPPNNLTAATENRSVNYCNTPVSSGAMGTCYADNPYYSANTWKDSTQSLSTNAWHRVDVYFKMNSISGGKGLNDGIMQEWVDGVQVINKSDVLYRTNQHPTMKWRQFVFAPYIGDGAPIAETFYIDNLNVYNAIPSSSIISPVKGVTVISVTNP